MSTDLSERIMQLLDGFVGIVSKLSQITDNLNVVFATKQDYWSLNKAFILLVKSILLRFFCSHMNKLINLLGVRIITQKLKRVEGHNLCLRLIQPDDAEYVFGLRTNPAYNEHLSAVIGTVEDQRKWIETYKSREANLSELYYVIERKDCLPCGVVRLYDIKQNSFTWGSWILDHNKPFKAALESAVLVYRIAFEMLELSKAEFEVRNDNANTLSFHRRFFAVETHSDEHDTFFILTNKQFFTDLPRYQALIVRGS